MLYTAPIPSDIHDLADRIEAFYAEYFELGPLVVILRHRLENALEGWLDQHDAEVEAFIIGDDGDDTPPERRPAA